MQQITFRETNRVITIDTEQKLLVIEFGEPTESEEESTELAAWARDTVHNHLVDEGHFVIADISKLDDSTLPSKEAQHMYAELLKDKRIAQVVFVAPSFGMKLILDVLSHTSGQRHKMHSVKKREQADAEFTKWKAEQQHK